jgi:hypothetical protein
MEFDGLMAECWEQHATRAREVAQRLLASRELVEQMDQIPRFAQLSAHVFGEHLGDWAAGIALLESLRDRPCFQRESEAERAVVRTVATLRLAGSGDRRQLAGLEDSELIRVLSMAASALAGQRELERALDYFKEALGLISGVATGDPAHRALAVTGNNLAADLEERPERTAPETDLMVLAARTARTEWEIAGTWENVLRAEYRLACTCLEAGLADEASEHARQCLEIGQANGAGVVDRFWSNQAVALVAHARDDASTFADALDAARRDFESIPEGDRAWCRSGLDRIAGLVRESQRS